MMRRLREIPCRMLAPKAVQPRVLVALIQCKTIGTLNKDDDDDGENDGKKMNLQYFKLNRVYLDSFNMSNAGDFSWS